MIPPLKKAHAYLRDPRQAAKCLLAVRWNLHPDQISDQRADDELRVLIARMDAQGEEVIQWMP